MLFFSRLCIISCLRYHGNDASRHFDSLHLTYFFLLLPARRSSCGHHRLPQLVTRGKVFHLLVQRIHTRKHRRKDTLKRPDNNNNKKESGKQLISSYQPLFTASFLPPHGHTSSSPSTFFEHTRRLAGATNSTTHLSSCFLVYLPLSVSSSRSWQRADVVLPLYS